MDSYYMKHKAAVSFWQHETAVSLLPGSTKLQFHSVLTARNCSFIAFWQHETAVSWLPGSAKLQFRGFFLHEAAVSLIVPSGSTKLPFHDFLGIRSCSFIAFWQHETAVPLLFGITKLQFYCFLATQNCSFIASW
jgi:hypothetical protein